MRCTIKSVHDVKVINLKLYGKKSCHVKGCCGLGQVQSTTDFDNLDDLGS